VGTLDLWVLELFAMYATDGQTDRQTDGGIKATLIAPSLRLGARDIILIIGRCEYEYDRVCLKLANDSALQNYGDMLPEDKFEQLEGPAFVKEVAQNIGNILEGKIQALRVSSVANGLFLIIVH